MHRPLAPSVTLVLVTPLLAVHGSTRWAWLAGPLVSLAMWALDGVAREPRDAAPAHAAVRRGATVAPQPDAYD